MKMNKAEQNLDPWVTAAVLGFLQAFQRISIHVPGPGQETHLVTAHVPYMLQSVRLIENKIAFQRLAERHQQRLLRVQSVRAQAPAAVRALLREQLHEEDGAERWLAKGRAPLADIQHLLQEAVDGGLVPAGVKQTYPDGRALRCWLKQYGIGIDCSGFVQQTLTHLMDACPTDASLATPAEQALGFLRCSTVYREILATGLAARNRFQPVLTPAEVQPGDVLVNRRHMRIVAGMKTTATGVMMSLAESTSASDFPQGWHLEDEDIGPRLILLHYPHPARPLAAQIPSWRRLCDDGLQPDEMEREYVYGRWRALAKLWER